MSYTPNINRLSKVFESIIGLCIIHEESVLDPINWLADPNLLGYSGKPFLVAEITQLFSDRARTWKGRWNQIWALDREPTQPASPHTELKSPLPELPIARSFSHSLCLFDSFRRTQTLLPQVRPLWACRNLPALSHPFYLAGHLSFLHPFFTQCDFKFPHYPVFPLLNVLRFV